MKRPQRDPFWRTIPEKTGNEFISGVKELRAFIDVLYGSPEKTEKKKEGA